MATKTVDIEVSAIYSFTYDPESIEFKKAMEAFKNDVERGGNEESMIVHVAETLRYTNSVDSRIGELGYLKKEGSIEPICFSGITVENDDPDFNYEIL